MPVKNNNYLTNATYNNKGFQGSFQNKSQTDPAEVIPHAKTSPENREYEKMQPIRLSSPTTPLPLSASRSAFLSALHA